MSTAKGVSSVLTRDFLIAGTVEYYHQCVYGSCSYSDLRKLIRKCSWNGGSNQRATCICHTMIRYKCIIKCVWDRRLTVHLMWLSGMCSTYRWSSTIVLSCVSLQAHSYIDIGTRRYAWCALCVCACGYLALCVLIVYGRRLDQLVASIQCLDQPIGNSR